jgi:hypothetical protein
MSFQLYWGDLHSHCSISYGEGTVEQALERARGQLDFCSITGHAFWPDMPTDRALYGEIIDYHREGFARLASNWPALLTKLAAGSAEQDFVTFPSYEWHSLKYGDHNVYARGPDLALRDAPDLAHLRGVARAADAILVPHHIGYAAGYRGIDWQYFDAEHSPIVEIYSMHGCSESDEAPYAMLHDMGPRDCDSTAVAGWRAGHRFGIIASTDHHGGFPGSHGDGRVAVWAEDLSRHAIWDALQKRRVYAVTGDKIEARMTLNDACIGDVVRDTGRRHIQIQVAGSAALDRVELLKNDQIVERFFPNPKRQTQDESMFRLRVTWGWGRKDETVAWKCQLSLDKGMIKRVEPCFSGQAIVAPRGVGGHDAASDVADLPHAVLESTENSLAWRSLTTGNRSTRHPTTQALSLELDAPLDATVSVDLNGQRLEYELHELLGSARATYLRGWLSEAVQVGPLDRASDCTVMGEFVDERHEDCDRYRLRVAQQNGQWAWLTPIWVEC